MSANSQAEEGQARSVTSDEVWALQPVLRRVVAGRVHDKEVVDDLVQDALEHLLAARKRLVPELLLPYGVVTARNLVSSHARRAARDVAFTPRLVDRDSPARPDEVAVQNEERAAMSVALARLPEAELGPLWAHEVSGVAVADLADGQHSVGTTRVRLARSRAKLRVEYLLALRQVELPTNGCRPALLVLAGGDRGRQRSVATGRHLLGCETCASLSEPLMERRRSLFILAPLAVARSLRHAAHAHPVSATAVAASTAAVVAATVVLATTSFGTAAAGPVRAPARVTASSSPTTMAVSPSTIPAPAVRVPQALSTLTVDSQAWPTGPGSLVASIGQTAVATGAPVQSVVSHNGFWVGSDAQHRVWVELVGPLRPLRVLPGEHVTFRAPLVAQASAYAASAGVDADHGAAQLTLQGAHLVVSTLGITITP